MQDTSSTTPDDHELLKLVSTGDEYAFKELYARYNITVYNYILRLIHEPFAAEDILQNVFLAVWRGAQKFRADASVKTWIFRIAHYQTVSWLRKNKNTKPIPENIEDLRIQSETPLPEEQILDKLEITQIKNALEKLSPNHRAVVELTFMYGFAYKEIAKIMDCPLGTVKSRMSYALRYLEAEIIKQKSSNEI